MSIAQNVRSRDGVTLTGSVPYFPEGTRFRPGRGRIQVKVLAWNPSRTLKIVSNVRPVRGIVVAIGADADRKKYHKDYRGETNKVSFPGGFVPMEVGVGETVEVGGLEIGGYAFQEISVGTERHIFCAEADVALVDEDPHEFQDDLITQLLTRQG